MSAKPGSSTTPLRLGNARTAPTSISTKYLTQAILLASAPITTLKWMGSVNCVVSNSPTPKAIMLVVVFVLTTISIIPILAHCALLFILTLLEMELEVDNAGVRMDTGTTQEPVSGATSKMGIRTVIIKATVCARKGTTHQIVSRPEHHDHHQTFKYYNRKLLSNNITIDIELS